MTTEATQEPRTPGKRGSDKVVKLKVYKNKLDKQTKQEQKEIFQEYFKAVSEAIPSPTGFAIVAWDDDSKSTAFIVDKIENIEFFSEKVRFILNREINLYLDQIESNLE